MRVRCIGSDDIRVGCMKFDDIRVRYMGSDDMHVIDQGSDDIRVRYPGSDDIHVRIIESDDTCSQEFRVSNTYLGSHGIRVVSWDFVVCMSESFEQTCTITSNDIHACAG